MIELNNESGLPVDTERLVGLATFALDALRIHPQAELSILLVDTDTMSAYHEKFMGEPGPTDVLSFPMDELRAPDYLLIHGLLHLLGHDHAEPAEKKVMFDLNDKIIAAWNTARQ